MGMSTKPKNLKQVLKDKGFTETELIEREVLSKSLLSRWQSGVSVPKLDTAIRFCSEVGLSLKGLANAIGLDTSGVPDDIPDSLGEATPHHLLKLLAAALGYSVVPITEDEQTNEPTTPDP
jgi:transcriptional regulator with XRE-family HTH domain